MYSIRFRNYTPKDDSLKEKVDNVVINQKPLSYEEDLKAASSMPSVDIHILFDCLEDRWNQPGSKETKLGFASRNWVQDECFRKTNTKGDDPIT